MRWEEGPVMGEEEFKCALEDHIADLLDESFFQDGRDFSQGSVWINCISHEYRREEPVGRFQFFAVVDVTRPDGSGVVNYKITVEVVR